MPIFDYECKNCGLVENVFAGINDKTIVHDKCCGQMNRIISGRKGINMGVGAYGYYDDNLQAFCGTNRERRRIMKEQGVSEKFGKGWK